MVCRLAVNPGQRMVRLSRCIKQKGNVQQREQYRQQSAKTNSTDHEDIDTIAWSGVQGNLTLLLTGEISPLHQQPEMGKPPKGRSCASQIKRTIEFLSSVL